MINPIHNPKRALLRLATAGSVDDGKSTLIGRLLYDCDAVYDDQLSGIRKISQKKGLAEMDLSLLTDGLAAEREQGITIDVAYRYFNTSKRRIIIADVPGHEQYTKNMITGASEADAVLILIDAGLGLTIQSRRHLFLSSLLGVPHIIVAVNKMDAVGYDRRVFEKIRSDFTAYAAKVHIKDLKFIPISALHGDTVVRRGEHMPWYAGKTLMHHLEHIPLSKRDATGVRLPIQTVIRAEKRFRGYAGKLESGTIHVGDKILILPSGEASKVKSIMIGDKKVKQAFSSQSVMVSLTDERDLSRGDMIVQENNQPETSTEVRAMLCCLTDASLPQGKSYLLKQAARTSRVTLRSVEYRVDIKTLHTEKANALDINDIGQVTLKSTQPLLYDAFSKNRYTGSFILIDEITKNTVAAGMITEKIKSESIKNETEINKSLKPGAVVWFTGLSGSGKSTIADAVAKKLQKMNADCERLDGDIVRKSLTKDLGFSPEDRHKNIERVSYVAGLLSKHGVVVLATFISPYKKSRQIAKRNAKNFIEVFVDAPLAVCEKRDVRGLYKKARSGNIPHFTGISDRYERPTNPHIHLRTDTMTLTECSDAILTYLKNKKII